MTKRFYIILFLVFSLSAILLGITYSKESDIDINDILYEENTSEVKIVYSSENILTKDNSSLDFSITNKSEEKLYYTIKLNNLNDASYNYVLDNLENKYTTDKIYTGVINSYGTDSDVVTHTLDIISDNDYKVKVDIVINKEQLLIETIKNSKDIYVDSDNNYRYYGENVNNYIDYDNSKYQIIGIINNKIKLISTNYVKSSYNKDNEYLELEDYLASFKNELIDKKDINKYKSWLCSDKNYWLSSDTKTKGDLVDTEEILTKNKKESYYERIIKDIDTNIYYIDGDGSIDSPYEVSYESK